MMNVLRAKFYIHSDAGLPEKIPRSNEFIQMYLTSLLLTLSFSK